MSTGTTGDDAPRPAVAANLSCPNCGKVFVSPNGLAYHVDHRVCLKKGAKNDMTATDRADAAATLLGFRSVAASGSQMSPPEGTSKPHTATILAPGGDADNTTCSTIVSTSPPLSALTTAKASIVCTLESAPAPAPAPPPPAAAAAAVSKPFPMYVPPPPEVVVPPISSVQQAYQVLQTGRKSRASCHFPSLLMSILSSPDNEDVIQWLPHGRSFIITDQKSFHKKVLSTNFGGCKYTSFTRRLCRWGFREISKGPDIQSYFHLHFRRDKPELCQSIVPKEAIRDGCPELHCGINAQSLEKIEEADRIYDRIQDISKQRALTTNRPAYSLMGGDPTPHAPSLLVEAESSSLRAGGLLPDTLRVSLENPSARQQLDLGYEARQYHGRNDAHDGALDLLRRHILQAEQRRADLARLQVIEERQAEIERMRQEIESCRADLGLGNAPSLRLVGGLDLPRISLSNQTQQQQNLELMRQEVARRRAELGLGHAPFL